MTAERTSPPEARISRDDIESKFRELQGEVDVVSEDVRSYAATVGAVVAAGVVVAVFWLGRTRGRRTRTVVEIRRF
jgi:hypothetical protein